MQSGFILMKSIKEMIVFNVKINKYFILLIKPVYVPANKKKTLFLPNLFLNAKLFFWFSAIMMGGAKLISFSLSYSLLYRRIT